jgi:TRAP-type C4-dicarboxylate transport system substrate-binding protein
MYEAWATNIEESTNNQVDITIYAGGTLLSPLDILTGIKGGMADMGEVITSMFENERPILNLIQMPLLGLGDWEKGYDIWMQIDDKFPEAKAEWDDYKVLFRIVKAGLSIHTAEGPVYVLDDLKGMKIGTGPMMAELFSKGGAVQVGVPPQDWYMSLERGLMTGMTTDASALFEMKCHTFLPYHTYFPSGLVLDTGQIVMNLDVWNSLPPDVQKAFEECSMEMQGEMGQYFVDADNEAIEVMKNEGQTFTTISTAQEKEWHDAVVPLHEARISQLEDSGVPAQAIYDEIVKLAKE